MKTFFLGGSCGAGTSGGLRRFIPVITGLLLLSGARAWAQATVTTLGGNYAGNANGNTYATATFNFPAGAALDPSDSTLFVADYNNNAIRMVTQIGDRNNSYTYTPFTSAQGASHPIAVAVDNHTNVYVLNHGSGKNGTLMKFDGSDYINYLYLNPSWTTNATHLTNATALAMDSLDNAYVTVQSNTVLRITQNGVVTTVGVITNAGTDLRGIAVMDDGRLALSDAGNNGIWMMDPTNTNLTGNAVKFTGFHGAGDQTGAASFSAFNGPAMLAKAGNGVLVVADYNNAKVKEISTNGTVTRLFGINPQYWYGSYPGWTDGTVDPNEAVDLVQCRAPYGLAIAHDGTVYDTEDFYDLIRMATGTGLPHLPPPPPAAPTILSVSTNYGQVILTWSSVSGASSYNVKRATSGGGPYTAISTATATSYTDTNVVGGETYYYVVSAVNSAGIESVDSAETSAYVPISPPSTPIIGWFNLEGNDQNGYFTKLHPVSGTPFIAYNDLKLAIDPNAGGMNSGVATYFTTDGSYPSPTNASSSTPPPYTDGEHFAQPLPVPAKPDLTIKAMNVNAGGNSAVATAEFVFQVGTPYINGGNAAQFTVSDVTTNIHFVYTTDGSDPRTNANATVVAPSTGGNSISLSLQFPSNTNSMLFQVVGIKDNYETSSVASMLFTTTNYAANTISFGFGSGEASSDFVGSPGEIFYAPVTLTTLPGTKIYSLQFNVTVTNASLVSKAGPPITPGYFGFQSMLLKPSHDTNNPSQLYQPIPPFMFTSDETGPLPPGSVITNYNGTNFVDLETINTNLNLLGVGWVERAGQTNLYNTLNQTLITYSQAHDDVFPNSAQPNGVIVGGYAFQIPATATNGQQYKIQIGRPSATDDGIGAPGSSVYIVAPTNGATAGGMPLNALKYVTVGQRKYLAGSVYPFRWFNAGDFGSSNIVNADVEQVFQSAIYTLNNPPPGSDFFDAMDSCGNIGVLDTNPSDPNYGYLTNAWTSLNTSQLNALFDSNNSTINQIAFGDGKLDVCDVYVTYRRSLDSSLTWFRRFWNNGRLVAQTAPNISPNTASQTPTSQTYTTMDVKQVQSAPSSVSPEVHFSAGDIQGSAGQTVQIPIRANIYGSYPLRVLMLNLTVEPLDGSPSLTTPVQFAQSAPLGTPYTTDSRGNGNYAAVWLNSTITGLTGDVTIGTLTVTIPASATTNAAYAVHFDHASASPNGLASFPEQTLTGLITLSSRTNSTYGDGIPDSWRLRWFGTVNNYLSLSNACPSGDGVNNWMKYVAGVDPNTPDDFPSVHAKKPAQNGASTAIQWPSVSGKQYVIERSTSLFPGKWTAIATNTGTGTEMEFDDSFGGATKFYRVRILP